MSNDYAGEQFVTVTQLVAGAAGSAALVPEPAVFVLMLFVAVAAAGARDRRFN